MKTCLINQPLGLGDILWVQPIVDHYLESDYEVVYPVGDIYYDMVSSYIKKDGLNWCSESDDFPLKYFYGMTDKVNLGEDIYLPLTYADMHNNSSLMMSKYEFAGIEPVDYRDSLKITRNYERENALIEAYGLKDGFIIVNETYGTYPNVKRHEINIQSNLKIHKMSFEQDNENGFHAFDWIGALESAEQVHSVGTSICYLIDKYCVHNEIHLYERRTLDEPRTYNREVQGVYRNPRWIYED